MAAAAAADAPSAAPDAAPATKTFTFSAAGTANWADEVDEEEEAEGRESARAAILDQLKEKYHSRREERIIRAQRMRLKLSTTHAASGDAALQRQPLTHARAARRSERFGTEYKEPARVRRALRLSAARALLFAPVR